MRLLLICIVLFYGCHRVPDSPIPAYPAPNENTEYRHLNGEILLSNRGYANFIEYSAYENYQGDFVKCDFEQCTHEDVYIAPMYLLFDTEQPFLQKCSDVYMWLDSGDEGVSLHSCVTSEGNFIRLDENGYFLALAFKYTYDKFDYDNQMYFWLQITPRILCEEKCSFRVRFYEVNTGVYYESKKYQVQVTRKDNEKYGFRIDEID